MKSNWGTHRAVSTVDKPFGVLNGHEVSQSEDHKTNSRLDRFDLSGVRRVRRLR